MKKMMTILSTLEGKRVARRVAACLLVTLLVMGILTAAPISVVQAGSVSPEACQTRDVYVPGGEAHWTECNNSGSTQVTGWVKDTRADGKCAQVYANFTNGVTKESAKACPNGEVENFNWSERARDASVYLRTVG